MVKKPSAPIAKQEVLEKNSFDDIPSIEEELSSPLNSSGDGVMDLGAPILPVTELPLDNVVVEPPAIQAPFVHVQPQEGTWKHLVKTELDEEPEEVQPGIVVMPIRGKFRKEIWNGDREVLIFPEDYIRELERDPSTFDSKVQIKLREHGFHRCQVVSNQVLQPSPKEPGEYVVVKAR